MRSMLKQLQLGQMDQSLLSFTDKAMMVEERKKLMESHYSQELSLLYILQEDYDRAKYYANYAFELFIQVCCHKLFCTDLFVGLTPILQDLRSGSDCGKNVYEYLSFFFFGKLQFKVHGPLWVSVTNSSIVL